MTFLLDTAILPGPDRAEVVRTAMMDVTGCSEVDVDVQGAEAKVSFVPIGRTAVFSATTSTLRMANSGRDARAADIDMVGVSIHRMGRGRQQVGGHQRWVLPGEPICIDQTRRFDWSWEGRASTDTLLLPSAATGLSADAVRHASLHVRRTTLTDLFSRQLSTLVALGPALSGDPSAPAIDEVSLQLGRAVLVEAAGHLAGRDAWHDTLEPPWPPRSGPTSSTARPTRP